ncbi:hypothetical protein FISHEDRAFT_54309 [Fistulina hepatica ATCC 64428]|uniref:Tyr recombinase domain-containing protein n=1 Tax=Fistulina hepatica ATCC 64428 TaxID=1128425 RepID=A0A0D6ZYY2_9AGAR|nr:hypothetical protein FISHEDRAFT_54309 [Fistulina hepatica ATCC 64428]
MNFDNPRARQPPRAPWTKSRLQFERAVAVGASIEPSSNLTYTSALQSYITFCRAHQFPIDPTPDTLSFYVVYMSHFIKPSSVNSYLSGICSQLEPFFPEVRHARATNIVRRSLTGCLKLYTSPTKRKRPLHHCELLHIAPRFITTTCFDDLLWWSIILTGFYGLLRLGELVIPDHVHLHDDHKLICRLSSWFLSYLKQFFPDDEVAGHSIRSGGATRLAELGVDLSIIQSIGRWTSDTFHVYIHMHPIVLAAILRSNNLDTYQV